MHHPITPFSTHLSGSTKETELRLRSIFQWRKGRPPLAALILVVVLALGCGSLVSCQGQDDVLHLGLDARILEIDPENSVLYVEGLGDDAGIFGSRCALDCAGADLLHVNYETDELTTLDFSQFQVGDTVIVGLYDSQRADAENGTAQVESVQLGTQRPLQIPTAEQPQPPSVPEDAKALILDYLQETWPLHPIYYLREEPGQPQEGDMRIDGVYYVEDAVTYETLGTAFRVERSGYHTWHSSDPGPSWQEDDSFIYVILGRDVLGDYYEVRGFEAPSANKSVQQIILEHSFDLMDLEVSLWRDGCPWPAGPGSQIHFFRDAYDGKGQVEILEGWEPVYWPGAYWTEQSWEGFSARCYHVGEEPGQEDPDAYVVYSIDTIRTDLRTYRGIRVGDTREQVMEAYPELHNTHYWHDHAPDFPGQDYLWYCINSEGFGPAILFFFENDVVSLIRLNNMFN